MQESEAKTISNYLAALEAAAVEYAVKYGVSEAFSKALRCSPPSEAFRKLDNFIDH